MNEREWRALFGKAIDEFEDAWRDVAKTNETVRIEVFVAIADTADREAEILEALLKIELEYRRNRDEACELAEYLDRFPQQQPAVLAAFRAFSKTAPRPDDESLESVLPDPLGRFRKVRLLGVGTFGSVGLYHDPQLRREVAIKAPNAGVQIRLLDEARSAIQNHPGFVQIYDVVQREQDGKDCIVMEYVEQTLDEWRDTKRTPDEIAALMLHVAEALQHLHESDQKKYHCDLKLSNILVTGKCLPKIADFGLVTDDAAQRSGAQRSGGTPFYMAPEQVRQFRGESIRIDGRGDIWAFGVILYELLTSERPFGGAEAGEVFDQILQGNVVPLRQLQPHMPRHLERICLKCLKTLDQRYGSAVDLAEDLREFVTGGIDIQRETRAYVEATHSELSHSRVRVGIDEVLLECLPRLFSEFHCDRCQIPHASLHQALQTHSAVVITADNGSGKTISMRQAMRDVCHDFLDGRSRNVPVWLDAAQLRAADPHDSLESLITGYGKEIGGDSLEVCLRTVLNQQRCWIFLDQVDELSDIARGNIGLILARFLEHAGDNRLLVASRSRDILVNASRTTVELPKLNEDGQRKLVMSACPARCNEFLDWLSDAPDGFEDLVQSPFFLACLVELFASNREMPEQRGRVLDRLFEVWITSEFARHRETRGWRLFHGWKTLEVVEAWRQALGRLALRALDGGELHVNWEEANQCLDDHVRIRGGDRALPGDANSPDNLLSAAIEMGALEESVNGVAFAHGIWRAYLSARELLRLDQTAGGGHTFERLFSSLTPHVLPLDAVADARVEPFALPQVPMVLDRAWQACIVVFAGLLGDVDSGGSLDSLHRWFDQISERGWLSIAAVAIVQGRAESGGAPAELSGHFENEMRRTDISLRLRLLFGQAVQRLGDRRIWEDADRFTHRPTPKVIDISDDEFPIGLTQANCDHLGAAGAKLHSSELRLYPGKTVAIPTFRIGKFPVTNSQFKHFVDAGGYDNPRYWIDGRDDAGWDWLRKRRQENKTRGKPRQPEGWLLPWFHQESFPVVEVTYYEALAYCRWLSSLKSEQDRGYIYSLPTIEQWQAAARGSEGRFYPWGDASDPARCNCRSAECLGATTPVGLYPDARTITIAEGKTTREAWGATPEGVADLAGNVAELCLATEEKYVPICGGSWREPLHRATAVPFIQADSSSNEVGFRVVQTMKDRD